MDEELKQRLVKYLDGMEEAVKTGGDFVAENAPETVRQYINYTAASHAAGLIGGICMLLLGLFLAANLAKYMRSFGDRHYDSNAARVAIQACLSGVFVVMGPIFAATNVDPLLKVWLAPNVFILEKLADIVK